MSVSREIIQSIRQKRLETQGQALITQGRALADELLHISGLLDKGIDPRNMPLHAAQISQLMALAELSIEELERTELSRRQLSRPQSV